MDSRQYASLLLAFRYLDQRQRQMLELAALVRGTYYADKGLRPWWPAYAKDEFGRLRSLSCHERAPGIQVGLIADKTEKLLDALVGEGRLPAFQNLNPKVLERLFDEDEFNLTDAIFLPAWDLVVKGSALLAFSRVDVGLEADRFEPLYMDTTFCHPIFAAQSRSDQAQAVREDALKAGVPLRKPVGRDKLWVPPGARADELIYLSYRPMWFDATKNEVWMGRRDFSPDVTVDFEPELVQPSATWKPDWRLAEEPDAHGWGLVPAVWERARGAQPGDLEGPSLLTPAVISVGIAADYTESLRNDAIRAMAWPQLTLIDVQDKVPIFENLPFPIPMTQESGSGTVMEFRSMGDHPSVSVTEPSGGGIEASAKQVADLRVHAERQTGMVEHDQEKAAGALSGTALEKMLEPKIQRVNAYRRPLGRMMRRLAMKIAMVAGEAQDTGKVKCLWPRVVSSTPDDLQAGATALQAANGGRPVISHKTSVLMFANIAEIADPEAEFKAIEKEQADMEERLFGPGGPGGGPAVDGSAKKPGQGDPGQGGKGEGADKGKKATSARA